jgi:hypothetical protein
MSASTSEPMTYAARTSPWINTRLGAIDYVPFFDTRSLPSWARESASVVLSIALAFATFALTNTDPRAHDGGMAATMPAIAIGLICVLQRPYTFVVQLLRTLLSTRRTLALAVATIGTTGGYLSIFIGQIIGVFLFGVDTAYLLPATVWIVALGFFPAFVAISSHHILSNNDATLTRKGGA